MYVFSSITLQYIVTQTLKSDAVRTVKETDVTAQILISKLLISVH
jgi:hypothetical protein